MENNDLKSFLSKRKCIKASLSRFQTFITNFEESQDINLLKSRYQKIEPILSEFISVQREIDYLDESTDNSDEWESFEAKYFENICLAQKIIETNSRANACSTNNPLQHSNSNSFNSNQIIKLPTMNLPEFDGKYDCWRNFHDTFDALVNKNGSLTNIQRFYYVKSVLKGEAAHLLNSLEVTESNYTIAWNLLKERYENKKLIINTHVKGIFELENVIKESHKSLRSLIDNFNKHLRSLQNLELQTENWDILLIYILSNKLDNVTKHEWEKLTIHKQNLPTVNELIKFLTERSQILETINTQNQLKNYQRKPTTVNHLSSNNYTPFSCNYCKKGHSLYVCPDFLKLSIPNRWKEITKLKLCVNCFRANHFNYDCRAALCRKCNKNHNTLLHNDYYESKNINSENKASNSIAEVDKIQTQSHLVTNAGSNESKNMITAHSFKTDNYVILSTAEINVLDAKGNKIRCRALLDSGSQSNFITAELFDKLRLNATKINLPVAGIGNSVTNLTKLVTTRMHSLHNNFNCELSFLVLKNITGNIPSSDLDLSKLKIPDDINLADNQFHVSDKIDILLGAGVFWNLLGAEQIKINKDIILRKTKLGWIFAGSIAQSKNELTSLHSTTIEVQEQLERFWKIEECENERKYSAEELHCEQHFVNNVKRDSTGRFEVSLPMRDEYFDFKNSLDNAVRRLHSLEKRFSRDPIFKQNYCNFMSEYEKLGHMSELQSPSSHDGPVFYLPHHGVIKESSITTKLRVVFDGSCKSTSGASLNDKLCVGPQIQDPLLAIILRFRMHNIVLTADIAKMYRQINVAENQRDLQRIVWRTDSSQPLRHFQLNTLTYGTAPASFLSTRCLRQLGLDNFQNFPHASNAIINDFYIDDFITGASTVEDAIALKKDVSHILECAGFELRQWSSNEKSILINSNSERDTSKYHISDDQNIKTLGLIWDSNTDSLNYSLDFINKNNSVTKRSILSNTAKIFDPLGLIGPVVIKIKLILQRLWREKLDWDEPVPLSIYSEWIIIENNLSSLHNLVLPRLVISKDSTELELHGFCDASETAYACCIYVRSKDRLGSVTSNLLCAKSKVAPLKTITIPRLELCGAVLLSNLMYKVREHLNTEFKEIYYWCDSTIVLSWLRSEPHNFQIFVANRITDVQRLSDISQWRHVNSHDNPADVISRGVNPHNLINNKLWWEGPKWLLNNTYPLTTSKKLSDIPELRYKCNLQTLITINSMANFDLMHKFSSLTKLQRVFAYVFRFIQNSTVNKHSKVIGQLTLQELNSSMQRLIKLTQAKHFNQDIILLKSNKQKMASSKILSLNPFIDKDGVLRVGGRLLKSHLNLERKHPIILPSQDTFTDLIIDYEHKRNMHSGVEGTLAAVRRKFWPLHGRSTVKRVLHKCVICARFRAKPIIPIMGNLPPERIQPSRPFLHTAVDYAGPFLIKDGITRNRKIIKAYLCVFVCFVTRAVHLELVGDLSTYSFLNAFKRFIGRRGICKSIYSDNGSNFVGANNELKRVIRLLNDYKFLDYFKSNSIDWRFIPARSPHFGGLCEAAVKSAKSVLKRVIGNVHLNFEQLTTIFVQIEAILNSRPITPISDDPNDLLALTPGHFLIGDALTSIPEEDQLLIPTNRLSHYTHLNQILQHFWRRWANEYMNTLQTRKKWHKETPNIKVGSMVLLKGENTPPLLWPLGRIVELHPGSDNVVRVVTVKTASGLFKRAVVKLVLLPVDV